MLDFCQTLNLAILVRVQASQPNFLTASIPERKIIGLLRKGIEELPAFGGTRVRGKYLLGMAKMGKKFALLPNLGKVLSTEELPALNAAPATAREEASAHASSGPDEEVCRKECPVRLAGLAVRFLF